MRPAKTAVAIRHVHFEDLGTFAPPLQAAGYAIRYLDLASGEWETFDPLAPDLLVVLGGPVGVCETDTYPFLARETALIAARLDADRPTLGVCLGAQLMAAALGAPVKPTGTKEIGFSPLTLTEAGEASPLRHLRDYPVLHWHGDAFAIPGDCVHLAATPACTTQGFARGRTFLGLQFHPEADTGPGFENWLVGHAAELAGAGIDPRDLRADAARFGNGLRQASHALMAEWIEGLAA